MWPSIVLVTPKPGLLLPRCMCCDLGTERVELDGGVRPKQVVRTRGVVANNIVFNEIQHLDGFEQEGEGCSSSPYHS